MVLRMIKELRFRNFYSFYESTEVSFAVGKKPRRSSYDVSLNDERFNKVLAILGPNGSGKTALLKPFAFLSWFIADSFTRQEPDDEIPIKPHALHKDESTEFQLFFQHLGENYRYELTVNQELVIHEALYVKTSSAYSYVFTRDRVGDTYEYKHKNFELKPSDALKVKANSSLVSASYVYGHDLASDIVSMFKTTMSNINQIGRQNFSDGELFSSGEYFFENTEINDQMKNIIKKMDLGLTDIEIESFQSRDSEGKEETLYMPVGVHTANSKTFRLPFFEESNGTKSSYVLLRWLIPVLNDGGLAIIDELDNDLHPNLLPFILDLFKHPNTNKKGAQLIFSCHTPQVMNLLMKHQVYLTEKDNLISEAWRLDSVLGLRVDDNIYAKYLAGALGATPDIMS